MEKARREHVCGEGAWLRKRAIRAISAICAICATRLPLEGVVNEEAAWFSGAWPYTNSMLFARLVLFVRLDIIFFF